MLLLIQIASENVQNPQSAVAKAEAVVVQAQAQAQTQNQGQAQVRVQALQKAVAKLMTKETKEK